MSILDDFSDMKVSVTPVVVTKAPNDDGEWTETETQGSATTGVIYDLAAATAFYTRSWIESVTSVLAVDNASGFSTGGKCISGGITYTIEQIQEPGRNVQSGFDSVYLIGLAVKK